MSLKRLSEIQRRPLEMVLANIQGTDADTSSRAGKQLVNEAKSYGLNLRDYLTLAVDVRASKDADRFRLPNGQVASGYEAALAQLNLPIRNDFRHGVTLQAAADTFNSTPGARGLFPEVIDDMIQWQHRQDNLERVEGLLANSRTVSNTELLSRVVTDDSENLKTSTVAEGARIPVDSIETDERTIRFYKHGRGIKTTYEFERRVSLDILTPYARRIDRQLELSKVRAATNVLVNGDGLNVAAPTKALSQFDADLSGGKTLKDNYPALMKFLVKRAAEGIPIDTVVGNLDAYLELFLMFTPIVGNKSMSEHLQDHGAPSVSLVLPVMHNIKFQLSSTMPAGKLLCYSVGDTLEELKEANSNIEESEKAIQNQTITYLKSEVTGYRLVYGDTRTLLDFTQ
jgi:hypothetical protein